MKIPLFLMALAVTTGCAAKAEMMVPPGGTTPNQYAPVNELKRIGAVRYLNTGGDSYTQKRRADAYRQMHDACNGKYEIISETANAEEGFVVPVFGMLTTSQAQYLYIQFRCVD